MTARSAVGREEAARRRLSNGIGWANAGRDREPPMEFSMLLG
jgi:hypothetical protein